MTDTAAIANVRSASCTTFKSRLTLRNVHPDLFESYVCSAAIFGEAVLWNQMCVSSINLSMRYLQRITC